MRVYRIPYSTNVERVSLALAHKGLTVEWVDVDPADRAQVRAVSGQDLVPVLEVDGRTIPDSRAILFYLEHIQPAPALLPPDPARRAEVELVCDWFDRVWKAAPNAIVAEMSAERPDGERMDAWAEQIDAALHGFEALLNARPFLMGGEVGMADIYAFPFLKYAAMEPEPDDHDPFHRVLAETQGLEGRVRLAQWIRRMDGLPRA